MEMIDFLGLPFKNFEQKLYSTTSFEGQAAAGNGKVNLLVEMHSEIQKQQSWLDKTSSNSRRMMN